MSWSLPSAPPKARPRDLVLCSAAALIVLQLVFRAWALYPSWFYLDDFLLLEDARMSLSVGYVLDPHDSQLMPMGRVVAWLVASAGPDWAVAATLTLAFQGVAGVACCWMLMTLFGVRPGVLVPLAVYLSSAMTMSSTMWWAASLNAIPLHIAFFCSTASWFRYLRNRRRRWLVLTLVAVAFGLTAYVKALVLVPFLGCLAVAYFAEGNLVTRLHTLLRRDRVASIAGLATAVVYLAYYLTQVPRLSSLPSIGIAAELAERMIGEALVTGMVGGPWRWDESNPPAGIADPPGWALQTASVAVIAIAVYWTLRRRRTGRAWLLLGGYVLASYLLLLLSRADLVGSIAGLEYRYLSDVTCAWALALGLLSMPLLGSDQGSAPRTEPLLAVGTVPRVVVAAAAVLVVSGTVSSVRYVQAWHDANDAAIYFENAEAALGGAGPVDLADEVVPDRVMPGYQYPRNRLAVMLPLLVDNVRFPSITSDLVVLDADGVPHHSVIDVAKDSSEGPDSDCGWRVTDAGRTIHLDAPTMDYSWWVRIGYLAVSPDDVDIRVAGTEVTAPIRQGARSLFLRVEGSISSIRFDGVDPDNTLCVDTVEVGQPIPGAPL